VFAAAGAELANVEVAVLGLGLAGDVHPAITRGAAMSASVMSKTYFFMV